MIKTVNSVSGGASSAYMAVNYPADVNIFAVVCIEDCPEHKTDPAIIKYAKDKFERFCPLCHEFTIVCDYPVDIRSGKPLFNSEKRILQLPTTITNKELSAAISEEVKKVIDKVMREEPVVKKDAYDEMGEIIARRFNLAQSRIDHMFMEAKLSLYTYVNDVRRQNNLPYSHALEQDRLGNISKMWEVNPKLLEIAGVNEIEPISGKNPIYSGGDGELENKVVKNYMKQLDKDWTMDFLGIPEIKRPVVWLDRYKDVPNFEPPPTITFTENTIISSQNP